MISDLLKTTKDWSAFNAGIKSCQRCPGLNSVEFGTQNAPGYGNISSRLMLIGQSLCGKACIEAQIPFTGGSGILLDSAFEIAGIEKKDVYITNIVKCHPPENRTSHQHEIKNCRSYLERELAWIAPEEVICLGKDAWNFFVSDIDAPCTRKITRDGRNLTIHFVYHPSYIRRKPNKEREAYVKSIAHIVRRCTT